MSIVVLKQGLFTTIQDGGRCGRMQFGVPRSGAMDSWSYRVANRLVGNETDAAVLEMMWVGPQLRFEQGGWISICGGDVSVSVDGRSVPCWRPVWIPAGSVLSVGTFRAGAIAYLAVRGGIQVDAYMGSRSAYVRGQLPGRLGRSLQAGDRVEIGAADDQPLPAAIADRPLDAANVCFPPWKVSPPAYSRPQQVRIIPGKEYEQFDEESRRRLTETRYMVTSRSDRMGYRLEGKPLLLERPLEMRSEGVLKGTVQVPPDGQPIVLMSDSQTTGGYPRIAQVAAADLPLLAQLSPGNELSFTMITLEEAEQALYEQERKLRMLEQVVMQKGGTERWRSSI